MDNIDEENIIINYIPIKYSESYNVYSYISWLFAKQQEYLFFYNIFMKLMRKCETYKFDQYKLYIKYKKIDEQCKPLLVHISQIKNDYLVIHIGFYITHLGRGVLTTI